MVYSHVLPFLLQTFLKIATLKINERASLPSNLEELSAGDYAELLASEPSRRDYQLELHQLKDEFEKYKTRAQSVLRSRGNKVGGAGGGAGG